MYLTNLVFSVLTASCKLQILEIRIWSYSIDLKLSWLVNEYSCLLFPEMMRLPFNMLLILFCFDPTSLCAINTAEGILLGKLEIGAGMDGWGMKIQLQTYKIIRLD